MADDKIGLVINEAMKPGSAWMVGPKPGGLMEALAIGGPAKGPVEFAFDPAPGGDATVETEWKDGQLVAHWTMTAPQIVTSEPSGATHNEESTMLLFGQKLPVDPNHWIFMESTYSGTCTVCNITFPPGMPVAWAPGKGAKHVSCWLSDVFPGPLGIHKNEIRCAVESGQRMTQQVYYWHALAQKVKTDEVGSCAVEPVSDTKDHFWRCECETAPWHNLYDPTKGFLKHCAF